MACLMLSSCATILSRSNWPVSIATNPEGARVEIWNRKGEKIYDANTPHVVLLKSGSGYFGKESYKMTLSMHGYEPRTINLECTINGWYFGNILIGGILGMLVVDPLTGAMYRLQTKDVYESLSAITLSGRSAAPAFYIAKKDEIHLGSEDCLVEIVPAQYPSKILGTK
jgi:hypothetical protein